VQLKANRVGGEGAARQARPLDRALALFDILLASAAVVVEGNDALGRSRQVGDDKADTRIKLAGVPHVAVAAPSLGRADAKVDLCHSADEAGPGTNLQRALTRPLNPNNATNNIIFECGGSATITVDRPLEIFQATAVDGANAVTLTDTNPSFRSSIFVVGSSTTFLFLRNLTLTHPNTQRQVFCGTSTCIGTVINAQGTTELDNVVIENSDTPVSATSGSLTVSQSRFTGNSGRLIVAGPGVTSTIVNSVFQNNPDTAPILASGTVNISGSQFVNNNSPLFFPGLCQLNVDNSTFQNNTDAALFINCSSVTISNSLFASNSASIFGAAIRFAASAQQICTPGDSRHVGFRQLFDV